MPNAVRRLDLAVLGAACFLLRLPALISGRFFDPDEAAIAVQARTLVAGGTLYRDMADRKPPVPPFAYSAWFRLTGTNDLRGMRVLVSALLAVAAVVLVRELARTHGRTVALWGGALYVLGMFAFTPADAAAANYAHFAVPFATIALVQLRRGGWWSVSGAFWLGIAILCRQSWIFAAPAAVLSVWMAPRPLRGSKALSLAAAGVAGAAAISLAALMAPWSDYWFWNFRSSPGFVFASIGLGVAVLRGAASLGLFLLGHLAAAAAAGASWRQWRRHADLWLWVVMGIAATSAGFRFYGHYWLEVLPPLVVLAAPVVAGWTDLPRRLAIGTLALGAVVFTTLQCIPGTVRHRQDAAKVAATIRRCTAPTDRIFVWGSFPELYVKADRPAAGTLVHMDFVTGRSGGRQGGTDAATPGAVEQMMDDLRRDPPVVLVDTSGVDSLGYRDFPMLDDPNVGPFARDGYVPEPVADGFVLWWRSDRGACVG